MRNTTRAGEGFEYLTAHFFSLKFKEQLIIFGFGQKFGAHTPPLKEARHPELLQPTPKILLSGPIIAPLLLRQSTH